MSDQKKDKEIREICQDSDEESSEVQDCEAVIQNVTQDILKESANKEFENVVAGNETVGTNSNEAPEMLQDILKESANKQFENVVDGNETVVIISNVAPEMLQDILKESANKQFENVVDGNETVVTISNEAPEMLQDILKESANKQFENVVEGNETVATNSSEAPEMLQTMEIGKEGLSGSLMPRESVQAPVNELPRNNKEKEAITSAAAAQPSKRRRRRSTGGISINSATADDGGPRRSLRVKERIDTDNNYDMYSDPYLFKARPLYMEKKRDEYAYLGEDSEYEDED